MITESTKADKMFSNIFFERGVEEESISGSNNRGIFFFTSSKPYLKSEVYINPNRCKIKSELITSAVLLFA